jgi:hypothetical protein
MSFGHERLDGQEAALENAGPAAYAATGIDPDADPERERRRATSMVEGSIRFKPVAVTRAPG